METVGLLYEAHPTRDMLSAHDINHRRYLRCFAICFACLCLCVLLYVPVYNQARASHADAHSVSQFQPSNNKFTEEFLFQLKVHSKERGLNATIISTLSSGDTKKTDHLSFGIKAVIAGWSRNTSRDLQLYVRPDNQTALIPQPEICSGELFLLIVVCSAVPNFEARAAIRDTWGSWPFPNSTTTVRIAFLLGNPENATLQEQVDEESLQFGDIIQEGFVDSYNNLTVKSVMLLKWVTSHCHSLHYVMKTDDDMFVNVESLVKLLRLRSTKSPLLIGTLICGARPISDVSSKWYGMCDRQNSVCVRDAGLVLYYYY